MSDMSSLWVLGHKIRLMDTDDSYGLIEVTSLPKVPGPPPYYHKAENEFFFIIKGTLDVMRDGESSKMVAAVLSISRLIRSIYLSITPKRT